MRVALFGVGAGIRGQHQTVRIGPTASVAKARGLFKTGWVVQIIDSEGFCHAPSEFDQLLLFDRHKSAKETPRDDVLCVGKHPGRAARAAIGKDRCR
jgi:hypothetical protein